MVYAKSTRSIMQYELDLSSALQSLLHQDVSKYCNLVLRPCSAMFRNSIVTNTGYNVFYHTSKKNEFNIFMTSSKITEMYPAEKNVDNAQWGQLTVISSVEFIVD